MQRDFYTKEEVEKQFKQRYDKLTVFVSGNLLTINSMIQITCMKCHHTWKASIKNSLLYFLGCYDCHKGQSYSIEEMLILKFLEEYYLNKDIAHQRIIYPKKVKEGHTRYYQVDGFSRHSYVIRDGKFQEEEEGSKQGTVFEVLGDYYHSNPMFYKTGQSPRKNMTHQQNYEYTMNRLKHIEEEGYNVFYIWVSDFKRFQREMSDGNNPNLIDYINIDKKITDIPDYSLLPKGSQRYFN